MSSIDPQGEMGYWDSGFPFNGIKNGSQNVGEMQFWDAGFPQNNYIPPATGGGTITGVLSITGISTITF